MNKHEIVAVTSRSFSNNQFLVNKLKDRYAHLLLNDTGKTLSGKLLIHFLKKADKAIIGIEDMSKNILSELPNLKVISKYGVGLNNIDLEFCKHQGIKLGFLPGVNKQSVAEFALTLILIGLKKIHQNHYQILDQQWPQMKGFELHKKKIGILGFGNIGQSLATLLMPFKCNILFFDSKNFSHQELKEICKKKYINPNLISQKNLQDVLKESDILSIHLPLNDETKNIIDTKVLELLPSTAVIVNTARGGIVNEIHLEEFLINNPKSFAAFDVFLKEPVLNSPLFKLNNFFGTSHRASLTHEGINAMGMAAIKGLDDNVEVNFLNRL